MFAQGFIRITLIVFLAILGTLPVRAQGKVALLIGNEGYAGLPRLANPARDVRAMDQMLRQAGFATQTVIDADHRQMIEAIRTFETRAEGADIALVFYSGHGLEMEGRNYLLPVDASLRTERDVEDETIALNRLLRATEGARRLKLVILDACRDNPLVARMDRTNMKRTVNRGLAAESGSTTDLLIAYATAERATAEDGSGTNSPFTAALVRHLAEPGLDVRIALGNVRDAVRTSTGDRQVPHIYGSVGGGTIALAGKESGARASILDPPPMPAPSFATSAPNPCAQSETHWRQAREFDRLELYEEHLRLFPGCPFAAFARTSIEDKNKGKTETLDSNHTMAGLGQERPPNFKGTYWEHNGSTVHLKSEPGSTARRFIYQDVSRRMAAAGAQRGDIVFDGHREGDRYLGTAYIFAGRCGSFGYPVYGNVVQRDTRVILTGIAPRVDPNTCRQSGSRPDQLIFEYRYSVK